MSAQFIKLTQIDGLKIALNVAHIIALSPRPAQALDPEGTEEGTFIHTTIGTEQRGWCEWSVREAFDDIRATLAAICASS